MADIRVVRMSNGYIISRTDGQRTMYVHSISRAGIYTWYRDYTYARRFSMKTAQKHADILKGAAAKYVRNLHQLP